MPAHASTPPAQRGLGGQVNDLFPFGDWIRHHSLRSWPVLLFLVLICVPSIALVILGGKPSASTFDHVAWIFAGYFALAWLLLLGVMFLGYAKVGSRSALHLFDSGPHPAEPPGPAAAPPAHRPGPAGGRARPWWEH